MNTVHVPSEEDATFERVETGRSDDRVYILQVGAGAGGRHFFWMQDRDASGDEDICVKVNLYLSDGEEAKKAAGMDGEEAGAGAGGGDTGEEGGMDNDQLLRIMQGALSGEQGRAVTGTILPMTVSLFTFKSCANVASRSSAWQWFYSRRPTGPNRRAGKHSRKPRRASARWLGSFR